MRRLLHSLLTMVARATAKAQRSSRIEIGDGALAYGRPHLRAARGARIVIGDNVSLVSTTYRNPLGINHSVIIRALLPGAEVVIGEGSGMSGGSISAAISVRIGSGTLLGANVTIIDTDSHPVNSLTRATDPIPPPQPEDAVSIGDNVLIGTGAMICVASRSVTTASSGPAPWCAATATPGRSSSATRHARWASSTWARTARQPQNRWPARKTPRVACRAANLANGRDR